MNCYFCQQETILPGDIGAVERCPSCPNEVRVYRDDLNPPMHWTYFVVRQNSKRYTCIFFLDRKGFKFYVGNQRVINWNFLPNLTPYNIKDKLPTLLTFL